MSTKKSIFLGAGRRVTLAELQSLSNSQSVLELFNAPTTTAPTVDQNMLDNIAAFDPSSISLYCCLMVHNIFTSGLVGGEDVAEVVQTLIGVANALVSREPSTKAASYKVRFDHTSPPIPPA
jgi:hypothetical protein